MNDDAIREREDGDARAARDRRAVVASLDETRPDDDVAVSALEASEQRLDLFGRVLSIAVELQRDLVSVSLRVQKARLHRSADAEVEGEVDQQRSVAFRDAARVVGRAVVDDEDVGRGVAIA